MLRSVARQAIRQWLAMVLLPVYRCRIEPYLGVRSFQQRTVLCIRYAYPRNDRSSWPLRSQRGLVHAPFFTSTLLGNVMPLTYTFTPPAIAPLVSMLALQIYLVAVFGQLHRRAKHMSSRGKDPFTTMGSPRRRRELGFFMQGDLLVFFSSLSLHVVIKR